MKSVILALLLAFASAAIAQTSPADPTMVRNEIAMLEFVGGGSTLTEQERQLAASIVADAMQTHPDLWTAASKNAQLVLAQIARNSPAENRALRETDRYVYAFTKPDYSRLGKQFVLEQGIINAHDPVIAIDPTHKRLVTRHALEILRQTSVWVAQAYSIAAPGPAFDTLVAADLKQQLPSLEPAIGDGIAHIERNAAYAPPYFAGLTAAQRTDLFVTRRTATFRNLQDPASTQWQLAEAAGMLTRFAATQTQEAAVHGTTSALLRSQQRQLNSLHNAAVGASPACNVTVGSYEDRAANGCYK